LARRGGAVIVSKAKMAAAVLRIMACPSKCQTFRFLRVPFRLSTTPLHRIKVLFLHPKMGHLYFGEMGHLNFATTHILDKMVHFVHNALQAIVQLCCRHGNEKDFRRALRLLDQVGFLPFARFPAIFRLKPSSGTK